MHLIRNIFLLFMLQQILFLIYCACPQVKLFELFQPKFNKLSPLLFFFFFVVFAFFFFKEYIRFVMKEMTHRAKKSTSFKIFFFHYLPDTIVK